MSEESKDSAAAREYEVGEGEQVPVADDGGDTPPGEGQIPAHDPKDDPADDDTESSEG